MSAFICGERNNQDSFSLIEADSLREAAVLYCEDESIDWDTDIIVFPFHLGTEVRVRPVTRYEVV